ncbi:sigma-54-dependent Fis family transcriptional regulator [Candidatus Aerophobetes bacterium]|uniref:Sigma-54-dependent Fis family transcriptional regulator n=1 Tax=Aerophobetes bacterium TaxID=2030807 RepID=A0A523S4W2_UNCAE|nr:MAG: sigma-54-dependent Fis family transcriptional regulator [Candidatus Aerophobetes bacterium]
MHKNPKSEQKNILLVDDDMSVRTVFSSVLRREGYRVNTVKDGYEAIKVVEEKDFDLALVDLMMPGLDGIQVLERIKSRRPEIRVVIYTGYGSVPTVVEAMRKGAVDYLAKPFSPDELKAGVKKALEKGED